MKKISVIGSGTMGNGIAHVFAQNNFQVSLIDISEEALVNALKKISNNLNRLVKKEVINEEIKQKTISNIQTFTSIKEGVIDSNLVIEAASENIDIKTKIFQDLDLLCPEETILATNTSSISITKIAKATKRQDKVIGMHFMNPVPIMKLVEVIKGKKTSKKTTEEIMQLSQKLNKIPVEVNDAPGFVANRILMPMINEAILTLQQDVSGVIEIDTVMKLGMSHPMGPLQLADFIGLDVCLSILEVMHEDFNEKKYEPCALLKKMVENKELGVKSNIGFYDYSEGLKMKKLSKRFI
ncbi:MAG: 3-hydroxybutyryl-CoA dehydrogenase [Flavobacteriales bacterium]|nr:3-hydroxybutyryl-CoA dehydrogenase [Flavobacteriales bacterium]